MARPPSRLFYFPPIETEVGVMPSFYDEVPVHSIADAVAMGGVDVDDEQDAHYEYERQLAYETEMIS